ncbi:MAG: FHIPEP family type III secretion protein [Planctomycetaceae bacterium]
MQSKTPRSTRWSTTAAAYLMPLAVLSTILVGLAPMPSWWVDMLLAANRAVSAVAVAAVVSVRSPLELSLFPTFLLGATLVRLVLNISTTRLILTRAATDGEAAAGEVVRAFGQFVSGESLVVGGVIFGVIAIVQLVVITAGATRIGEVAARFTLDAMPGRQAALDAEQQAGTITADQARSQRPDLRRQADVYASMDGAGRFVRGEAVAGMAIIGVNLVGGLLVGVVQQGMSIERALQVYSTLTIGDGLVGAVPALLVSVATGLLISRSAEPVDLVQTLPAQFVGRSPVLVASAVFLIAMALTGFPPVPLVTLATGLGLLASRSLWHPGGDQPADPVEATAAEPRGDQTSTSADPFTRLSCEQSLRVTIGRSLLHLIASPHQPRLIPEVVACLRGRLAEDIGILLPPVTFDTNGELSPVGWRVSMSGETLGQGEIVEGRVLALPAAGCLLGVDGLDAIDPLTGRRARWIAPHLTTRVTREGGIIWETVDVIARGVEASIRVHASSILSREATSRIVEGLRRTQPAIVDGVIPERVGLGIVHRALQSLLAEGVPLVPLAPLFELLADHVPSTGDTSNLAEQMRIALSRRLRARLRSPDGRLTVIRIQPELLQSMDGAGLKGFMTLANQLRRAARPVIERGRPPVVVVPTACRQKVRDGLASTLPGVTVLAEEEISDETFVEVFATIGNTSPQDAAASDRSRAA